MFMRFSAKLEKIFFIYNVHQYIARGHKIRLFPSSSQWEELLLSFPSASNCHWAIKNIAQKRNNTHQKNGLLPKNNALLYFPLYKLELQLFRNNDFYSFRTLYFLTLTKMLVWSLDLKVVVIFMLYSNAYVNTIYIMLML